jgi:hypothetical protein
MEIGPYRVKDDKTLAYNEGAWNEFANVLFVDNPVGTGFSYVDTNAYVHELDDMAEQFVTFLEKWYALFPEYEHDDVSGPLLSAISRLLMRPSSFTSPESRTPASTSPTSPSTSWPATRSRA